MDAANGFGAQITATNFPRCTRGYLFALQQAGFHHPLDRVVTDPALAGHHRHDDGEREDRDQPIRGPDWVPIDSVEHGFVVASPTSARRKTGTGFRLVGCVVRTSRSAQSHSPSASHEFRKEQ
jgi:hypothetical protein